MCYAFTHTTICDGETIYNATLGISFSLKWDSVWKINAQNLSITYESGPTLIGCKPSAFTNIFLKLFSDWTKTITDKVRNQINEYIKNLEKSFSLPRTVKLAQGLFTNYTIQRNNIQWVANESVLLVADAEVFGEINGKNATYIPSNRQEAHLPINTTGFPGTDSKDPKSHLLQASRLSSVFLSALIWYADKTGQLFYHNNATVLDSFLNVTMFISPPEMTIPKNGVINVTINVGMFEAMCRPIGSSTSKMVLGIHFNDLKGSGAIAYTNDSEPGFILRLIDLNPDYMKLQPVEPTHLPLPSSLEVGVIKNAINQSRPLINSFFENNPLILPNSITPYIAHPVINVFAGVPQTFVGYVEMSIYCTCDESGGKFTRCEESSDICASSKLTNVQRKAEIELPQSPKVETSGSETTNIADVLEKGSNILKIAVHENGNCNVVESTVDFYNVKITGNQCKIIDLNLGLWYKLISNKGPLYWECFDQNCLECQIIAKIIAPNRCYSQSNLSLSIGPVCQEQHDEIPNDSIFLEVYSQEAENCNDDVTKYPATQVAAMGQFSGPFNECVAIDDDFFNKITADDKHERFNVSLYCFKDSNCSECNVTQKNLAVNQCFQSYYKLKKTPDTCKVEKNTSITAIISTIMLVLQIAFYFAGCFLLRTEIRRLLRRIKRALQTLWDCTKNVLHLIRRTVQNAWKKFGEMIFRGVKENIGFRTKYYVEDVFQIVLCILSFGIVMWQSSVWLYNDTVFVVIAGNITGKVNLLDNLMDTKNATDYFTKWEDVIAKSMEFSGGCLCIPFVLYVILPRLSFNIRVILRIIAITACLLCSLAVPMLPLFIEDFGYLVNLGSSNVTGIGNPKILNYVQAGLQRSFTGMVAASYSGLVMNLFQGLNAGMFLAVLIHQTVYEPKRQESIIVHQMYNLIVFGTILQVFFSIHPVIVWTQYSSTDPSFFLLSALLWILPLLSWIFKTFLASIFQNRFPSSGFTAPTFLVFILIYVTATAIIIEDQKRYYEHDFMVIFIVSQLVNTLVLCFSLTYMFLSIAYHNESNFLQLGKNCLSVQSDDGIQFRNLVEDACENDNDQYAQNPSLTSGGDGEIEHHQNGEHQNNSDAQITQHQYLPLVEQEDVQTEASVDDQTSDGEENAQDQQHDPKDSSFKFSLFSIDSKCFSKISFIQYILKALSFGLNWLLETIEHENSNKYGLKIEKRRLFLSIGCLAFSYAMIARIRYVMNYSARDQIQHTLNYLGLNLTWPNATIFDDAFIVYNKASFNQTCISSVACVLFWLAFLSDVISYKIRLGSNWKFKFLFFSRLFGIFGGLCIFASIAILAQPNYMGATHFEELCPDCGVHFNEGVKKSCKFLFGLFIGVLFTLKLAPVLFTVAPALVRTSVLILVHPEFKDQKFSQWDDAITELPTLYQVNKVRATLLKGVSVIGGMSVVPLTLLAAGILVQFVHFQESESEVRTVITFIVLFWAVPFILLLFFLTLHSITEKNGFLLAAYFVHTVTYFASLVSLIWYCLNLYHQLPIIAQQLKTFTFYCELISEIFLTNISLSDLLYIALF